MKLLHLSRDALALGLALGAALFAYRFVLDLGLMGWDTYPLIAASQIDSAGDWFGLLTDELMGGRYPDGSFYRPVTSTSFALDHRLWQLDPAGYLTTNLLILLAEIVVAHRVPVATAVVGGITVVALTTSHLLFSSLGHDYPTWRTISREQSEFLASLDAAIASASDVKA